MLSRDDLFSSITGESNSHCKTDQVANETYSLPLIMTDKRGTIYEDICSSAHFFLAKNTHTEQKKPNPKYHNGFFFDEWVF